MPPISNAFFLSFRHRVGGIGNRTSVREHHSGRFCRLCAAQSVDVSVYGLSPPGYHGLPRDRPETAHGQRRLSGNNDRFVMALSSVNKKASTSSFRPITICRRNQLRPLYHCNALYEHEYIGRCESRKGHFVTAL